MEWANSAIGRGQGKRPDPGQRINMRFATRLLLLASLVYVSPYLLAMAPGATSLDGRAEAQSIEVGGGARIAVAPGRRANVRAEPEVRAGNVLAAVNGGDLVRVVERAEREPLDWYRVESHGDAPIVFQGWIRSDLLTPAALPEPAPVAIPLAPADDPAPRSAPDQAPPSSEAAAPLPLNQRTDWSRDLIKLFPAIEGCVALNSAPPVTVLRSTLRNRGLADVMMADDAGRRWDCVISQNGGTPIRYDPLSGSAFPLRYAARQPFFLVGDEPPVVDPACYEIERISDPDSGAQLGWLYYRICE